MYCTQQSGESRRIIELEYSLIKITQPKEKKEKRIGKK